MDLLRDLGTLLYQIQGQLSDFCILEIANSLERCLLLATLVRVLKQI